MIAQYAEINPSMPEIIANMNSGEGDTLDAGVLNLSHQQIGDLFQQLISYSDCPLPG